MREHPAAASAIARCWRWFPLITLANLVLEFAFAQEVGTPYPWTLQPCEGKRKSASALPAWQFLVLIQGNLFEVLGFEDLIAVHTSQIVDPVPPHQELRALVFTARHRMQIIPYSNEGAQVVKPPISTSS